MALCKNPYTQGMSAYGCGQCLPCRISRRRLWMHRIVLEALVHPRASFVTLTYDEESLPDGGTLIPRDLQLFLKRARKIAPLRFFGVGEYGDESQRPHYHLALFGWGVEHTEQVRSVWGLGHVYVGELTFQSAAYIAGYVVKKLTRKDDPRLGGRYPEFARMSLKPGIGAVAIKQIAEVLQSKVGWDEIEKTGDVPAVLKHGKKKYPLGRYLRRKLREEMNFVETGQTQEAGYLQTLEMRALYENYKGVKGYTPLSLRAMLEEVNGQKILNMETRDKIWQPRKTL